MRLPASSTIILLAFSGLNAASAQAQPASPPAAPAPVPPPALPATAAEAPPADAPAPLQLEQVEIVGTASDTSQRRQSTAAKIIIGREEIERMGDNSVAEVLKRLPGVTLGGRPGRGGAVRMRGLGSGYTQILVNGERLSAGLSLDDLTPEQVERIEVLRAPTAETGAQAIAGTINIVLREDVRKRLNTLTPSLTHDDGHWHPALSWTRADQDGGFGYNFNARLSHTDREDHGQRLTVETLTPAGGGASTTTLDRIDLTSSRNRRDGLHAGGRLQWRTSPTDTLQIHPFVVLSQSAGDGQGSRAEAVSAEPIAFDRYQSRSHGQYRLARVNGQWQGRLDRGARLEVKAGTSVSRWDGDSERQEFIGAQPSRLQADHTEIDERWWSTGGKYTRNIAGDHLLAAGWEAEWGRRNDQRISTETLLPGGSTRSLLGEFGDDLQARTQRTALWAQDEWDLDPQWALHGGLRWEAIRTRSDALAEPVRNDSQVLSPLLHALYRLEPGGRDQVRASLTRSYRAPTLQNLAARRVLATGTNEPTNPDRAGNPDLRPELATGFDLAYERYLAGNGVLSAGVFHRRIHDLIRNETRLETVTGSATPRYVSRPQNIGNATTSGVELEAKFRLDRVSAGAPAVDLRGNLALFRSRVQGIAGPDNRLDQQPGWTANLGADHRLRGTPLTIGANLALTPGYAIQLSETQRNDVDAKRVLDAYVNWTFSPLVQLRVSASNIVARDYASRSAITVDDGTATVAQHTTSMERSRTAWNIRLEFKL